MTHGRHMHANLMGAAGREFGGDQTMGTVSLDQVYARQRRTPDRCNTLTQPVARIAPDRRIDGTPACQDTFDNRAIAARDIAA